MKKRILLSAIAAVAMSSTAFASDTSFTATVPAVNLIAASGTVDMTLAGAATAGANFTGSVGSGDYAITSNTGGVTITAELAAGETLTANNLTLSANVTAPTASGASEGATDLSTTAADVVTGITNVAESAIGIGYTMSLADANIVPGAGDKTATVTYTLVTP